MWNDVRARHFRNSSKHSIFVLGAAGILALGATLPAFAHNPSAVKNRKLETCPTATFFNAKLSKNFHAPYNEQAVLKSLLTSPVGKSILPNLWVNARQAKPCFAMSDTPIWGKVVSRIPADIVALEVSSDLGHVLVYTTGLPDYKMETPKLFSGFKPGNIYGVYLHGLLENSAYRQWFLEQLGWRGIAEDWARLVDAEIERAAALIVASGFAKYV